MVNQIFLSLILLIRRYTKKRYLRKGKRKFWVREIFRKININGLYYNLVQELQLALQSLSNNLPNILYDIFLLFVEFLSFVIQAWEILNFFRQYFILHKNTFSSSSMAFSLFTFFINISINMLFYQCCCYVFQSTNPLILSRSMNIFVSFL